jgi:acetyl esterase/lipase
MAARGWTVFAVEYRLAPVYRFPAQIEDVRAALRFVEREGARLEADPRRIVLLGRSAGGHLAMLAAYGRTTPGVVGVISYYGPSDLIGGYREPPLPDPIDVRRTLERFLGTSPAAAEALYRSASPASYARRALPPTLLVHGGRDNVVEAKFARRLDRELRAAGNRSVLVEIPWSGHAFDLIFRGPGNQLALYFTERFAAWTVR